VGATIFNAIVAILLGVFGAMALFWAGNALTERIGGVWEERIKPWVFFGPALFVVVLFLLYPLLDTIRATFYADRAQRGVGRPFVGLENYQNMLTDSGTYSALWNNILWMIFVPLGAVVIGLTVAVLADRLAGRAENVVKSLVFLPMAISFVGASVIWTLVYQIQPPTRPQTGILNAILTGLGQEPIAWFEHQAINDFALMFIMVWLQAGFAMVLLSAAIKSVPDDTLEAARIDGANEVQVFFRVVVPQIRSTIVVVTTTILILVLKVFDIVRVTTNGRFNTDVVANLFYTKFELGQYGSAGVVVVLLVLLTVPFMIVNVRRFREQEAMR
jgi:alpha-glucoside transport system permease protein